MVISFTVTESQLQKLAGIPIEIFIETNVPASIFYTLDGTEPSIDSDIYIDKITLNTTSSYIIVKFFATNGVETTAVVSQTYGSNLVGTDIGSSKVLNYPVLNAYSLFPFGDHLPPNGVRSGPAIGLILNQGGIPEVPDGYNADGQQVGQIDVGVTIPRPLYSTTDKQGRTGRGIGTLPNTVTIRLPTPPPDSSSTNSKFFNPKARVIFQSYDDVENQDVLQLNRSRFGMQEPQKYNNGALYAYEAPGSIPTNGSLVRQLFNPKDSTLTYYYFDSINLRWIISKEKYVHSGPDNYLASPNSREKSAGIVLKWLPFFRKSVI